MAQAARAAVTVKIGLRGTRNRASRAAVSKGLGSGQRLTAGVILASVAMCHLQVCAATRSPAAQSMRFNTEAIRLSRLVRCSLIHFTLIQMIVCGVFCKDSSRAVSSRGKRVLLPQCTSRLLPLSQLLQSKVGRPFQAGTCMNTRREAL
jgi:hypothetical protein